MPKKILITGASGFLGSALSKHFVQAGYDVVPLTRDQYTSEKLPDESLFRNSPIALIHCGWNMDVKNSLDAKRNVEAALTLKKICSQKNIQFVFISSMAAHPLAHSLYGRSKLEVEKKLYETEDCIIKPGTIIGKGGLFLRTLKLAQLLPILPVFYKKTADLQTIHIDDLCRAVVHAIDGKLSGTFAVAHEDAIAIEDFYLKIAALSGEHPKLISLSGDVALFFVQIAEALGLRLPITSDNLLGLKYAKHFDTEESCKKLGINPLSFNESLYKLGL